MKTFLAFLLLASAAQAQQPWITDHYRPGYAGPVYGGQPSGQAYQYNYPGVSYGTYTGGGYISRQIGNTIITNYYVAPYYPPYVMPQPQINYGTAHKR